MMLLFSAATLEDVPWLVTGLEGEAALSASQYGGGGADRVVVDTRNTTVAILEKLSRMRIIRLAGNSRAGFLVYTSDEEVDIDILWLHPSERRRGLGREIVRRHLILAIREGRCVDYVQPNEGSVRFWEKLGYVRNPTRAKFEMQRSLLDIIFSTVTLLGDLPSRPSAAVALLATCSVPYFSTATVVGGRVRLDRGRATLFQFEGGEWELRDVTVGLVCVLRGHLAASGIFFESEPIVDRTQPLGVKR